MLTPRLRGGVPYQQPLKYVPAPGEVIHVERHVVFIVKTFVDKMNAWYDMAVGVARPWDTANARVPATAWDLRPIVLRCRYAAPETLGIRIDRERIAFRHEDFPGYVFIAVLEGVTPHSPVGRLTFISMVYEQKPPADRRTDVGPMPVPDWPPPDCPPAEAIARLERARVAFDVWINGCPDRHPKLDEAYATRRTVIHEMDRLLRLPTDDFTDGLTDDGDADGIFDAEADDR